MKWQELSEAQCPIARSLSILGDRWTLLIIRNAFLSTKRFDDFQKQLGITRHLLTERLQRLVDHNILEKVLYQPHPPRYEYCLTTKGQALYPILFAISAWGNQWENDDKHPLLQHLHKACGQPLQTANYCLHCNTTVDLSEVLIKQSS